MIIKIVVAGSRHFSDYSLAEEYICDCLKRVCPEDTPIFL